MTWLRFPTGSVVPGSDEGSGNATSSDLATRNEELERQVRDLSASVLQLLLVVESCPAAMLIADEGGNVVLVNQETERLFGMTRDELLACKVEDLVPEPIRCSHAETRAEFFRSPQKRSMGKGRDLHARRKDGTEVPVEIGLNPIKPAQAPLVLSIIVDISERKIAAEQLRLRAEQLERTNHELDQFASVASHDLRAPLRAIDNLSKWIAQDLEHVASEETRRHLALMRNRVQRMDSLLTSLLNYARIGRTAVHEEAVETRAVILQAWELLAPPDSFRLSVAESLPTLLTPRAPFELVIRNLIGNALKHHDKPTGRIGIEVIERDGDFEFFVSDDGPGIPAEFRAQVFEMFRTLRPQDEVEGGGMGLSLVKKTVEVYGGSIRIEAPDGPGTVVVFSWPKQVRQEWRFDGNGAERRGAGSDSAG